MVDEPRSRLLLRCVRPLRLLGAAQDGLEPLVRLGEGAIAAGDEAATGVEEQTHRPQVDGLIFGGELGGISENLFNDIVGEIPSKPIERAKLDGVGALLTELLVHAGLCPSKGQARKDIEGGGVYLNNVRAAEVARAVTTADLLFVKFLLLRKGKRSYTVVRRLG